MKNIYLFSLALCLSLFSLTAQTPGDLCADAIDINSLFGQATTQLSDTYNDTGYSSEASDPAPNCLLFFDSSIWFSFTGDGASYTINSLGEATESIHLYSGSCDNLTSLDCDDGILTGNFNLELQTEVGVEYFMLIDVLDIFADFQLEVTLQCPEITLTPTLTGVCVDAGIQAGLGGGLPAGGVYSGLGITDDGNGMTFSFDPATAGVGAQTVTYTVTESNIDQEQADGSGGGIAGFDQTGLAQSFVPMTSQLCGAGVLLRANGGSGEVTIELWDNLPNVMDANMLASGTVMATESTQADVSWPAVNVMSGETYYLVFSGANVLMGIAGTLSDTYASGQVHASGFPFPNFDYAFRTFTCSTGACSGEATAQIEVFALPEVTFVPSISTVAFNAGTQSISGGMPLGGVYSGNGVTDDGNGMTYSFDPAVAGVGENVITYTFTDENTCSDAQGAIITVTAVILPGDVCPDANDINPLFGGAVNEAQISDIQNNTGYNAENDPGSGYDCWFGDDPVLNNTIWYAFTGDGEKYGIRSIQCDSINPMTNTDTQFALYSGDCTTPVAVVCNDDEDFANQMYNSYFEIVTEPGVDYLLMVDGYVAAADYTAIGTFCLEVTRLETVSATDISQTALEVYPNPTTGVIQISEAIAERVEVFDNMGRLVQTYGQATQEVDLRSLPAGLYILKMYAAEEVISARVIKE